MPANQAYPQVYSWVENNDQQFSDVRLTPNIHEAL